LTPEAALFLAKARLCLADAVLYEPLVPRIAGREAYLAAYHAAEALVVERSGKAAKTHNGPRAEFARLTRNEPRIDRSLAAFPGQAYELKSIAGYGTGAEASISATTAQASVDTANRFVECIAGLIGSG